MIPAEQNLYKAQFEHALSMPVPDEWGQEAAEDADHGQGLRVLAIQESYRLTTR